MLTNMCTPVPVYLLFHIFLKNLQPSCVSPNDAPDTYLILGVTYFLLTTGISHLLSRQLLMRVCKKFITWNIFYIFFQHNIQFRSKYFGIVNLSTYQVGGGPLFHVIMGSIESRKLFCTVHRTSSFQIAIGAKDKTPKSTKSPAWIGKDARTHL